MKRGDCGCRNHRGRRKVKYPSKEVALSAIVRVYMRTAANGANAYECPHMEGVWHINTTRKQK